MLEDIDTYYFPSPSCYPERAVEGEEHFEKGAEILTWFVHLFRPSCYEVARIG